MHRHSPRLAFLILLALVTTGCGGGSSNTSASPTTPTPASAGGANAASVVITIAGMNGDRSYGPNPASVRVGQTVAWRNADSVTHTATADGGAFNTGNIAPGATSAPITMTTAGNLAYHCALHPSMVGSVTVQ